MQEKICIAEGEFQKQEKLGIMCCTPLPTYRSACGDWPSLDVPFEVIFFSSHGRNSIFEIHVTREKEHFLPRTHF